MPAMPRPNNKARKIAYKIMGIPQNMVVVTTPEKRRANKQIIFEETARVR